MDRIPVLLIVLRFLLGPALYALVAANAPGVWVIAGATAGFLSDVFDGIIARRLGVATERLREADSWTDTWYYIWVAAAAWRANPETIAAYAVPLLAVLGLQALCWAIDFAKYRRFATYHQYSAKLWGITLFLAAVALLGFRQAGPFLWLTIAAGALSLVEGIAMTLVLPRWTHDVKGLWHALELRRSAP
ncbi:MAG: CDP-alcohol phosphatidyltransferase [Cyanobacteria bacterium RYN_339]|nr:CDP-alcohol phosphatidyltransferase [Cyanobacteria bacterium RYN_339]